MLGYWILSWSSRQQKLTTLSPSWQQMTFGAENWGLPWWRDMKPGPGPTCSPPTCSSLSCERVFSFHLAGCVKIGVGSLYEKGNGEKANLKINLSFWEKWSVQGENPVPEAQALLVLGSVSTWIITVSKFSTEAAAAHSPPHCQGHHCPALRSSEKLWSHLPENAPLRMGPL